MPAAIPLAHLLPTLLRHAIPDRAEDGGATHGGWVLARTDGAPLDPAQSLLAQGIREGDLLVLRPAREPTPPPLYDDVVEVIGAKSIGTPWQPAHTRAACAVLAILAGTSAAVTIAVSGTLAGGIVAVVAAVLLLAGSAGLARAAGDVPAGTVAAALAAPLGAVGATTLIGGWGPAHLLLAGGVVLVVAALGAVLVGGGDSTFAALAVTGLFGLLAGLVVVLVDSPAARTAALVAPLALATTTALPSLALRLAKLPRPQLPRTAQDIADVPGHVEWERTGRQVEQARRLLTGLVAGSHAVVAIDIAVLAGGDVWSKALAAVLTTLVALRARLFREHGQVLAPVVTIAVALVAVATGLSTQYAMDNILVPSLLVLGLVIGLSAVIVGKRPPNPRVARVMDIVELLLLLAVVPVVLAVWDVYSALLDIGS